MPRAAAAFLFTMSSYSVEVSTGRSAALAPFRSRKDPWRGVCRSLAPPEDLDGLYRKRQQLGCAVLGFRYTPLSCVEAQLIPTHRQQVRTARARKQRELN